MTVTLGRTPDRLVLHLVAGDPFAAVLTYALDGVPAPWPAPPAIEVGAQSWTATLSGDALTATIVADETQVAAAITAGGKARLTLSGVILASGVISVHG